MTALGNDANIQSRKISDKTLKKQAFFFLLPYISLNNTQMLNIVK